MEIDLTRLPRIARLLGRLEESRRLATELPDGHVGRADLEQRTAQLYAEVGRYVHWLLRQDPDATERVRVEGLRWADAIDAELGLNALPAFLPVEATVSEADEGDPSHAPSVELTADSRIAAVDVRDLPEIEALPMISGAFEALRSGGADRPTPAPSVPTPPDPHPLDDLSAPTDTNPIAVSSDFDDVLEEPTDVEAMGGEEADDIDLAGVGTLSVRTRRLGASPAPEPAARETRSRAAVAPAEGDWLGNLSTVLQVLGEPSNVPLDAGGREQFVHSIVAATSNFEVRWSVFPDAVQQALLGLVAARGRRAEAALGADPDVKLAMGRMRRYTDQRSLTLVPALRPGTADGRDWFADERRYWNVLRAGL